LLDPSYDNQAGFFQRPALRRREGAVKRGRLTPLTSPGEVAVRWWRSFAAFGALSLLVPSSTLGGTITGVVRRASDGAGLPNFAVRVYDASTSLVTTVATDDGGAYSVTGLPSGTYFAHVAPFDFTRLDLMPELFDGLPCPPRAPTDCRIASGTPISVTAGATTAGIDFSLDPASTISGTVVAADTGAPLSRRVAAYAADVEVAFAQTNASGQYTLAGLAPGLYRVRASIPFAPFDKYVDTWYKDVCVGCAGTPSAVIVPPSANVTGIDFSLASGGTISGTVTCEIGPRISSTHQVSSRTALPALWSVPRHWGRNCDRRRQVVRGSIALHTPSPSQVCRQASTICWRVTDHSRGRISFPQAGC
jgi:hypothetical protein